MSLALNLFKTKYWKAEKQRHNFLAENIVKIEYLLAKNGYILYNGNDIEQRKQI